MTKPRFSARRYAAQMLLGALERPIMLLWEDGLHKELTTAQKEQVETQLEHLTRALWLRLNRIANKGS